jgi:hypothetical protein
MLAGALGTAALVAVAVVSPRVLPYNMDEFVHYHALGCATAPLSQDLPSFRDLSGFFSVAPSPPESRGRSSTSSSCF